MFEKQVSANTYYLSNKVYIHIDLGQLNIENIYVDYSASLNSFFTIQYSVHSYNKEQLEEIVSSGESYLVQIDLTSVYKTKGIYLQNRFYKNGAPYMANFFALNCEYEVTRGEEKIEFFDGYAQEIVTRGSSGYESELLDYNVKINEQDLSIIIIKCVCYMFLVMKPINLILEKLLLLKT